MEAYLDNSATTKCCDAAVKAITRMLNEDYGNPSAKHKKGYAAKKIIEAATEDIAKIVKADKDELYFTSGGTESNNWALFGAARANRDKKHIITTAFEHSSDESPISYLEEFEGYEVTRLKVNNKGLIDLEELKSAIREDTLIVSVIGVNNEMGARQDLKKIAEIIKAENPSTLFHVDGIQWLGKLKLTLKNSGIDLFSCSAHKFHGPKGVGMLYIRKGVEIKPLIFGGGQQNNMRSGTDNTPGIVGIAEALKYSYSNFDEDFEKVKSLRKRFIEGISEIEGVRINQSDEEHQVPQIISLTIDDVLNEVLMRTLEEKNIYISAGSACSNTQKKKMSRTLKAIGLTPKEGDSTVRVSLNFDNTEEEIDYAVEEFKKAVEFLRQFTVK